MKILFRIGKPLLITATSSLFCLGLASSAMAENASPSALLLGPWSASAPQQGLLLAQAPSPAQSSSAGSGGVSGKKARPGSSDEIVEAPWYGRNNMHKYLGLAAIGAAALTMVAPKENGGAHEMFANASAALGGAALATGAYAHWDDVDFTWQDPDTKHALFGALGTLGIVLAVTRGGEGGHAGAGALGAIGMITAIKYTW